MPLRVVVADDDEDVLAALCAVFAADERYAVAAAVTTGPAAVEAVARERPDVVLLDVRMPGNGLAAAREIAAAGPGPTTVIAVSAAPDARLVAAMLHAGARGVLAKGRIGRDLPDLVERCVAGEVIIATPAAGEGLRLFAQQAAEST